MQIKYKHLILPLLLCVWTALCWGQAPQVTSVTSKSQTDTVAVRDTLDYDQSDRIINWLKNNIVLSENQKEKIKAKGKSIKKNFKKEGTQTEAIVKQLQAEYKVVVDSILTTEQKNQLAAQFNTNEAKVKNKSTIAK
ncbi:MAG: hypothetical protein PHR83_05170 [Paludibacter sp.]|nr:hypothetical protein [Paludibacter sp.]